MRWLNGSHWRFISKSPESRSRLTNLVENAIRPTALGKKNGDADAGERSAIIYSIIGSRRRHGVEPYSYLDDVLSRLPSMTNRQIKDIVPKAWAAARSNPAFRAA